MLVTRVVSIIDQRSIFSPLNFSTWQRRRSYKFVVISDKNKVTLWSLSDTSAPKNF